MAKKKPKKKDARPVVREYIWSLHTYLGPSDTGEMGRYMLPVGMLENGLTHEFVINELNAKNCFDFEYMPTEGDNLIINDPLSYSRLEFIFRDGKWVGDHYSPFDVNTKMMNEGLMKSAHEDQGSDV